MLITYKHELDQKIREEIEKIESQYTDNELNKSNDDKKTNFIFPVCRPLCIMDLYVN